MSTATTVERSIRLTPLGKVSPFLAAELEPHLDLATKDDGGVHVLFDGAHPIERAALHAALTTRRSVTIVRPAPEVLRSLRDLTGAGVGGDVEAVTYSRGRGGYSVCPLLRSSDEKRPAAPLGTRIADGFYQVAPFLPVPQAMFAKNGSLAGYVSLACPNPMVLQPPVYNDSSDDAFVNLRQAADFSFLITFYVYYVNGGSAPYFAVIASLTGTSINNAQVNGDINLGWFRPLVWPTLWGPAGTTMTNYSPESGDATNGLTVAIDDAFSLLDGDGDPYTMNASIGQTVSYPGWAVAQEFFDDGSASNWYIYQSAPWNPYIYPPEDWESWYATNDIVFDPNWKVMQMTDLTLGNVSFQTLGEWYVQPATPPTAPFTSAPSTPFSVKGQVQVAWALAHNSSGCTGSYTGTAGNHFFYQYSYNNITCDLDLGVIANAQVLTLPS